MKIKSIQQLRRGKNKEFVFNVNGVTAFIFLLAYINCAKGLCCDISIHACNVL
jgi:hypothetical protein